MDIWNVLLKVDNLTTLIANIFNLIKMAFLAENAARYLIFSLHFSFTTLPLTSFFNNECVSFCEKLFNNIYYL